MKIDIKQTAELLKSMDDILILAHENPDGDAVGSACALCLGLISMGKNAKISIERQSQKLKYLMNDVPAGNFEHKYVVACDTADCKILGVSGTDVKKDSKIDLCIDHHYSNVLYAENTYLDETAAGACEAVYDLLNIMNVPITKEMAECLYVGIATDTGCFRYSNTTAKTLRTAAALIDAGADNKTINRVQFETKSKEFASLERMAIGAMQMHFSDKCAILPVTFDMFMKSKADDTDTSALASIPREIEGVLVGITIKERTPGEFRISVRTNPPADASVIAATLGGGGHKMAAGCSYSGKYKQLLKIILTNVSDYLTQEGLI